MIIFINSSNRKWQSPFPVKNPFVLLQFIYISFFPEYVCGSRSLYCTLIEYICFNLIRYSTVSVIFEVLTIICTKFSSGKCLRHFVKEKYRRHSPFETCVHIIIFFYNLSNCNFSTEFVDFLHSFVLTDTTNHEYLYTVMHVSN